MANAKSYVTYIDGTTSSNTNEESYLGYGSVNLGLQVPADGAQNLDYQAIRGVDQGLGQADAKSKMVGAVSDRAPNLASGYAMTGVPTYGDGVQNKVTVWADDQSNDTSAAFRFATPQSGFKQNYADLV